MTGPSHPHLLLLAGAGGLAPQQALKSIKALGASASLVYIAAWASADAVRSMFDAMGTGGEAVRRSGHRRGGRSRRRTA